MLAEHPPFRFEPSRPVNRTQSRPTGGVRSARALRRASVASHTPGGSRSSTSISASACASSAIHRTAHLGLASRLTGSTTLVRKVISHHTGSLSIVISLYIISLPYLQLMFSVRTSICTLLYGSIGTLYHRMLRIRMYANLSFVTAIHYCTSLITTLPEILLFHSTVII